MNCKRKIVVIAVLIPLILTSVLAQQNPQQKTAAKEQGKFAAGGGQGGNTPGRVAKFTTPGSLGDANITEDAAGRIGIGTTLPTSLLTVNGVIELMGAQAGLKFPDGTLQTTAGLATVTSDATLKGAGTPTSPLGLALPLKLDTWVQFGSVLEITNRNVASHAITATGGADGGMGLRGYGTSAGFPGDGVLGVGGDSSSLGAGYGVGGAGGDGDSGPGGAGVSAAGGWSRTGKPGNGVDAGGGWIYNNGIGNGGIGMRAVGGVGRGAGKSGGTGIEAFAGNGEDGASVGLAGKFNGNVLVTGVLAKAGGSFKIDHPLDPENKYLSHSFVESPDMKNIYDGVVPLDNNGEAVVEMPEWFGALNRDYRYLLTALGAPMPGLYIAEEITNNRFKISGGTAGMKVSWQVTGIRRDAWANKNRIQVEEKKQESDRGLYLHPEAFDRGEERGIGHEARPEPAKQMNRLRPEAEKGRQPRQ